jgi:hypothetical protein
MRYTMTDEQKQMINIDGKDYVIDDFNDEQKHLINQLTRINAKQVDIQMELEQIQAAKQSFINALMASIKADETESSAE